MTTQLGYPSDPESLAARLARIQGDEHCVLVATDQDDQPTGWIHVAIEHGLEVGTQAVIRGLVVDEGHRSGGIGLELLQAGEAWSRDQGIGTIVVRSRIARERAHGFYVRAGYGLEKTSHVFSKPLTETPR